MKIQRSKFIRIQVTALASSAVIFSVLFCYFLGWNFEIRSFAIAIGILISILSALWLFCYLLIRFEHKYYVIEHERVALWQKNEILCELKNADMIEIKYIRFAMALLMQMGSGYLHITCPIEALPDRKFASLIMPNGIATFEISMSKKQAKECAKILGKELVIK